MNSEFSIFDQIKDFNAYLLCVGLPVCPITITCEHAPGHLSLKEPNSTFNQLSY